MDWLAQIYLSIKFLTPYQHPSGPLINYFWPSHRFSGRLTVLFFSWSQSEEQTVSGSVPSTEMLKAHLTAHCFTVAFELALIATTI